MQLVSSEYKASMLEPLRNRSKVNISIGILNEFAKKEAVITNTPILPYSNLSRVLNNKSKVDNVMTLEKDYFRLDGKGVFKGVRNNQGVIFSELSGSSGVLSSSELVLKFLNKHDIGGLTIRFDDNNNTYPTEFGVVGLLKGLVVFSEIFTNTTVLLSQKIPLKGIDEIRLNFTQLNKPNQRLRISELLLGIGINITDEQLLGLTQVGRVNNLGLELPYYSLEFSVNNLNLDFDFTNPNGLTYFLKENQKVTVEYGYGTNDNGEYEMVKGGVLYLTEWKNDNVTAKFKAESSLSFMNEIYHKGIYTGAKRSYYDLVQDVITDIGLSEDQYYIDTNLKNRFTKNPLPLMEHKMLLQLLANASRSFFYVNRDGSIIFEPYYVPKYTLVANTALPYAPINNLINLDEYGSDYATMENNFFTLDNRLTFKPSSGYKNVGWVSSTISDSSGGFNIKPSITITFDGLMTTNSVNINFDNLTNNYPKEVKMTWYRNNQIVSSKIFTNNQTIASFQNYFTKVDKILIEFDQTKNPNHRVRVGELFFGDKTNFWITNNNILSYPNQTVTTQAKNILVHTYNHSSLSEGEVYNESQEIIGTKTILVTHNELVTNKVVTLNGGTLLNQKHYGYASELTISGDGIVDISIVGNLMVGSSTTTSIKVNDFGEDMIVSNQMIDNSVDANLLANWIYNTISVRELYDVVHRGFPEVDAGDFIFQETNFNNKRPVRVLENKLEYNGALRGSFKTRGVVE